MGADRVIRAVTAPLGSRLVRQIAPSAVIWKHGSPRPRRSGANVASGFAGPAKVTVRAMLAEVVIADLLQGAQRPMMPINEAMMTSGRLDSGRVEAGL
jgi:hypothetical protein